jgi:propionate CoA-transferase
MDEAVAHIANGATLASSGFRFAQAPEGVLEAVGRRFRSSGAPRDLTLVYASAQGDTATRGLDHLAAPGLLRRIIGGFYGVNPKLSELVAANAVEAYNLPQGQLTRLYHAIASGQPGLITKIGLGTFVDPALEGGRMNARTIEQLIDRVELRGETWLLYRSFPIDVGLIRGSTADDRGNISCEDEAVRMEALPLAMAAHNSGGIVIAQVKKVVKAGTLKPRDVEIPGALVDYVVVAGDVPAHHRQTLLHVFEPSYNGSAIEHAAALAPLPQGERKVICRRAATELQGGDIVNIGSGIPEGVGAVLAEQGRLDTVYLSLESGVYGGVPQSQPEFGVSRNPEVIIRHDDQFALYSGGGIDITFLGFAQVDATGNVNVSRFGPRIVGSGGFVDIAQRAKRVIFCGTFTSGGLDVDVARGVFHKTTEGKHRKFVKTVDQITYSGVYARESGQHVRFVTERAVFAIAERGLTLIELAPGADLDRDVLAQMDFRPAIAERVLPMDAALFRPGV